MNQSPTVSRACIAEFVGTFILVLFGVGCVHSAVLTGAQSGLWQVAIVFGLAISLAIYATGAISGTHINPAVTVSMMVFRGFPVGRVLPYIGSQVAGAFLAAAVLYAMFSGPLQHFENANSIVRGKAGSEMSAMCYGEYFPNPAIAQTLHWSNDVMPLPTAMLAEAVGTAFLVFFVFSLTDDRNRGGPGKAVAPLLIGLGIAIIISIIAPLTQSGLNPARDFGPRLFAWMAGWGDIAIPGPRGGFFTVYILAPIIGGLLGAAAYSFLLGSAHATVSTIPEGRLPGKS